MEHSEEIARMEQAVAMVKEQLGFIIDHMYGRFGNEAVTYAIFETMAEGWDYFDPEGMERNHAFMVECLHECINKAAASNIQDDDSAVS